MIKGRQWIRFFLIAKPGVLRTDGSRLNAMIDVEKSGI